jgi:hypothetical protein
MGYRPGRLYLVEQFRDGKISERDFRSRLALIGKQAFEEAERRRGAHTEASFETLGQSFFQLGCFQSGAIERCRGR